MLVPASSLKPRQGLIRMVFTARLLGSSLGFLALVAWIPAAIAQSAETPAPEPTTLDSRLETLESPLPEALQQLLDRQISAANAQDLETVMATYHPEFKHEDGLSLDQMQEATADLWGKHENLNYEIAVKSWENRGPDLVATLVTEVEGRQKSARGSFRMSGLQEVRNHYRPNPENPDELLLLEQEVIRESYTLTSGEAPPTVTMKLPDIVETGSTYALEAIVEEPLRNNVVLGTVIEEQITAERYLQDSSYPLEPLQAGGLFRTADAPKQPGKEWISVMLVSQGGITLESRRITVTDQLILDN
ncbi:MAG: hypothetical protein HC921_19570 [Synechococcaceae cyanobacterium SM2_3_1]|nr:hypothetical protein [Synechococcaceae cyanobacterium SM2_3_1]